MPENEGMFCEEWPVPYDEKGKLKYSHDLKGKLMAGSDIITLWNRFFNEEVIPDNFVQMVLDIADFIGSSDTSYNGMLAQTQVLFAEWNNRPISLAKRKIYDFPEYPA